MDYTDPTLGTRRRDIGLRWQDLARCAEVDPELFFPEKGGTSEPARRICAGCEVRLECLDEALTKGEVHGVRGGLSEAERKRLRKSAAGRTEMVDNSAYETHGEAYAA